MYKFMTIAILFIQILTFGQSDPDCLFNQGKSNFNSQTSVRSTNMDSIIIPVVVHVVYRNEEQNISTDQIATQINLLNHYFNLSASAADDPQFYNIISPSHIYFGLAAVDPQNKPTSAITRTTTSKGPFGTLDIISSDQGGKDPWSVKRYLNIWVCDLADNVIGMAGTADPASRFDGVIIDFKAFGNSGTAKEPFHLGKSLVHEIGHYLGLQHPEGIGGCDHDDGIEDTPLQSGAINNCQFVSSSCGSADIVQNFMNLLPDSCAQYFTKGQVTCMRNYYFTQRTGLKGDVQKPMVTGMAYKKLAEYQIYPNPCQSTLYLEFPYFNRGLAEISAVDGKVKEINIKGPFTQIDVSHWRSGVYFIKANIDQKVIIKKFIKQ